jgi:hypothetical protein
VLWNIAVLKMVTGLRGEGGRGAREQRVGRAKGKMVGAGLRGTGGKYHE